MLPTSAVTGDPPTLLHVPELPPDATNLEAALLYAAAGWYVLPVRRGTKDPGSVVGKGWQHKSSRDPDQIAAWFAATDHGIALHCGRSGAVVFDVDRPDAVPDVLNRYLSAAPYQSTRPDAPRRGHYVFAMLPGRMLGNGKGKLGGAWGEVRGAGGVIIVEPTPHPDSGRYHWEHCGPLPPLPDELAALLPDGSPAEDAASDATVAAFLAEHVGNERPDVLDVLTGVLAEKIAAGESRHDSAVSVMAGAMKEARAGLYPAQLAEQRIGEIFLAAMAVRDPERREVTDAQARSELRGIVAWAIGQALVSDPAETRARVDSKVPAANATEVDKLPDPQASNTFTPPGQSGTTAPVIKLTRLADVMPESVEWLWPGYLPLGKVVTLDGDPSNGKSTLSLQFGATVTTAGTWPDGSKCEHPGAVVILSAEDGLADTIRPRLDVAGADVTRVHSVDGVPIDSDGTLRPPTLADIAALEHAITSTGARLLIIDVLMAYLPTGTDSHKDQDIRRPLMALAKLAERTRCTVLLLRHLTKTSGRDPLYRGGGSIGIVGAARAGLVVAPNPDDPDRLVLASVKSNLAPKPQSLNYRIMSAVDNPDVARVSWEGVNELTAEALLADRSTNDSDPVQQWLQQFLSDGRKRATAVYQTGEALGYSIDRIKRAKRKLGASSVRDGEAEAWFWELPDQGSTPTRGGPDAAPLLPYSLAGQAMPETPKNGQGSKGAHAGVNGAALRSTLRVVPDPAPLCDCGQPLLAPESIARGYCEPCRLNGAAVGTSTATGKEPKP